MDKPVLVVMAAGMGSRYGGLKQMDPMDDSGHVILDFSVYDAMLAGFEKVIFIIKRENEDVFRECIGDRIAKRMQVEYAYQDLNALPEGFSLPREGRNLLAPAMRYCAARIRSTGLLQSSTQMIFTADMHFR